MQIIADRQTSLAGTAATATVHTLHNATLLQLRFRHATYTICAEICIARLDATQTAKILVAGLLPLGYQVTIGNLLLKAIVIELATYGFSAIEQIVDVSCLLVVNLENWPKRFRNAFPFMWLRFCLPHFLL